MRVLAFVAKAIVSAVLIYVLLHKMKLTDIWSTLQRIEAPWIGAVVAILMGQIILGGLRWAVIAGPCGPPLPASAAIRYTLIGTFFNQLLPSTIGGDATRIWYLARERGEWAGGTYSVFIDRVLGMCVLTLLVFAFMPWTFLRVTDPSARVVLAMVGGVSLSGVAGFLALSLVPARWADRLWIARHLRQTAAISWRILAEPRVGGPVIAYSLAIIVLSALAWWCSARAVASPLSLFDALLLVPPITLIATLPISIGGWGVREAAVVAAFGFAGLPTGSGLVMSFIFGLAGIAVGAVGGLLWIAIPASVGKKEDRRG